MVCIAKWIKTIQRFTSHSYYNLKKYFKSTNWKQSLDLPLHGQMSLLVAVNGNKFQIKTIVGFTKKFIYF